MNPRTPIPPPRGVVTGPNACHQPLILLRANTNRMLAPGVIAAPGHREHLTQHLYRIRRLLRLDEPIPHADSLAKKATVGSSDRCNTLWGTVEWEGDRDETDGTSGLVCGPESRPVAAMETGAVIKRDRPGARQTCRANSWRGVLEWSVHSRGPAAVALGADARGTRGDFAGPGGGSLYTAHCGYARARAVNGQSCLARHAFPASLARITRAPRLRTTLRRTLMSHAGWKRRLSRDSLQHLQRRLAQSFALCKWTRRRSAVHIIVTVRFRTSRRS